MTIICSYIVQSINSLWFALGWPTAFIPFFIVTAFVVIMKRTGLTNTVAPETHDESSSGRRFLVLDLVVKVSLRSSVRSCLLMSEMNFAWFFLKYQSFNNSHKGNQADQMTSSTTVHSIKRAASTKPTYSHKQPELHSTIHRERSVTFMSSQFLTYFE